MTPQCQWLPITDAQCFPPQYHIVCWAGQEGVHRAIFHNGKWRYYYVDDGAAPVKPPTHYLAFIPPSPPS